MSDIDGKPTLGTEPMSTAMADEFRRAQLVAGKLLLLVYHQDGTEVFPLGDEGDWIIGRQEPADILIRDRSLSRQHAKLTTSAAGIVLEDLDSTNGTRVNGKAIERRELVLGDRVTLGAVTLALHSSAAGEALSALEGHERFVGRLEEEVKRARQFRRGFAVLMVRGCGGEKQHVSHFASDVRLALRPVDQLSLYAADRLEVLLPEADEAEATRLAEAVVRAGGRRSLCCALALYPSDGTTGAALLEACSRAVQRGEAGVERVREADGAAVTGTGATEGAALGPAMRALLSEADRVASAEVPILILGETGSGKEVLARRIHAASRRAKKPLLPVNCGAIPEQLIESTLFGHERGAFTGATESRAGVFETAHGGTVLLDEVGELPTAAQAALLRALDTHRITRVGASKDRAVDVRVLAATHRDLEQMVSEGLFRQDLLYRLNTIVLALPPLRKRPEELEALASAFIDEAARRNRCERPALGAEALAALRRWSWPGNVRELRNVLERAVVIAQEGEITIDELPPALRARRVAPATTDSGVDVGETDSFKELVQRYETRLIVDALRACGWNQSAAALRLQMPRRTLIHKMGVYGIRKLGYAAETDEDEERA